MTVPDGKGRFSIKFNESVNLTEFDPSKILIVVTREDGTNLTLNQDFYWHHTINENENDTVRVKLTFAPPSSNTLNVFVSFQEHFIAENGRGIKPGLVLKQKLKGMFPNRGQENLLNTLSMTLSLTIVLFVVLVIIG